MITTIHAKYVAVDTHIKLPTVKLNTSYPVAVHYTNSQTLRTCVGPSVILCTFLKTYTLLNCTNSLTHYVHKHALVRISQEDRWGKVSFESQPIICVVI